MTDAWRPDRQSGGQDNRRVILASQAGQHSGYVHVRGGQHPHPVERRHQTIVVLAQDEIGVGAGQGTRLARDH